MLIKIPCMKCVSGRIAVMAANTYRVLRRVSTWELDGRRSSRARATNLPAEISISNARVETDTYVDLEAGHVELSTTNTAGDVERYRAGQMWWPIERTEMRTNDFSTDQVVSRSNTGGDGESEVAAVVLLKASRTVVKSNIA